VDKAQRLREAAGAGDLDLLLALLTGPEPPGIDGAVSTVLSC
jgi:hypothetical protein